MGHEAPQPEHAGPGAKYRVPGAHLGDAIVPVIGMPFRPNGDGDRVLVKVALGRSTVVL